MPNSICADFGAAGADQPEQAENLAGLEVEAHVIHETGARQEARAQHRPADRPRLFRKQRAGLAADHVAHRLLRRERRRRGRDNPAAGAQDRDVVAQAEHFVDEVTDEQDRDTLLLQLPYDLE